MCETATLFRTMGSCALCKSVLSKDKAQMEGGAGVTEKWKHCAQKQQRCLDKPGFQNLKDMHLSPGASP